MYSKICVLRKNILTMLIIVIKIYFLKKKVQVITLISIKNIIYYVRQPNEFHKNYRENNVCTLIKTNVPS